MAKPIRERDGKAILYNHLTELVSQEKTVSLKLPPLLSLTVGAKTNLQELTRQHQWLEKEVSQWLLQNVLILGTAFSCQARPIVKEKR